jgi:GAF domain-containing protein
MSGVGSLSTIWDQITRSDHQREIENRFLRPLLDGIAWSHNLPVSLVRVSERDDKKSSISWLARSFQSPFVEICRASKAFRHEEDTAISKIVAEADFAKSPCVTFDAPAPISGLFATSIVPTQIKRTFIVLGPVLVRCENGSERFSEISKRQKVITELDDLHRAVCDAEDNARNQGAFSKTRADRLIFQRAPMLKSDLESRSRSIHRAFFVITSANMELAEISAGSIEALSKLVSFVVRNHDENNNTKETVFPLQASGIAERCFGNSSAVITVNTCALRSYPELQLSFDNDREVGDSSDVDFSAGWSRHCDYYRSLRNSYFLERLLVTRLWLQDRFAGTTIFSATGTERQEDFSAFAAKVADLFAADGCIVYRFHPGEASKIFNGRGMSEAKLGYLHPLGSFYAYDDLKENGDLESNHMARIAEDPQEREQSANYRCVDTGKVVFLENAQEAEISAVENKPKSVLVAPLISRGRIWGTIEVIGKYPFHLPMYSERWLSEFAQAVTPIFYNQWVFFHFREMSRIAVSQKDSEEKYEGVLDHVRQLFLASSARLYIQHESRTSLFERAAHAGVTYPEGVAEKFELTSSSNVSAKCISEELPWKSGTIGEGDFEEEGHLGRPGPLEEAGHQAAIVFPVNSQDGLCFASVFVSSLHDNEFPEAWLALVDTLSRQLSVILEAIHLQDRKVAEQRAYIAHTVKTRIDRVLNGSDRVLYMLDPLFGSREMYKLLPAFIQRAELALGREKNNYYKREDREVLNALKLAFPAHESAYENGKPNIIANNVPKAIADMSEHLRELRISAVAVAGGNNAEAPFETRPALWGGTPCRLRLVLAESLKHLGSNSQYRSRLRLPPKAVLDSSVAVAVPELILIEIFNNLFDNAIKYDFSTPSLSYSVKPSRDEKIYSMVIRNLAPRLAAGEADKIRCGGERAWYAEEKDFSGSGLGLKYSIEMANRWGMNLRYDVPLREELDDDSEKLGWHALYLEMQNVGSRRR